MGAPRNSHFPKFPNFEMDFSFQEFHIHRFPNECFSFQELQNLRSSDRRSSDDDFTLDGIVAKRAGGHPWE